jgi:GNAT superfamily N-acetyltransferase
MTAGEQLDLRELTSRDAVALAAFSCHQYRAPWSDEIEAMVRTALAAELEAGGVEALGLWSGAVLVGVVAWRIDSSVPGRCRCLLLAVRRGQLRRGLGRRLKEAVLDRARACGAAVVLSEVHWDNDAMIELNVSLGANVERIAGDPDHVLCVIPL